MLIPFASREDWLRQNVNNRRVNINAWIKSVYEMIRQTPTPVRSMLEDLRHLALTAVHCHNRPTPRMLEQHRPGSFSAPDVEWLIKASIELKDRDIFLACLSPRNNVSHETLVELGRGIWEFKLDMDQSVTR